MTKPYHVTGRCVQRDFFPRPLQEVWAIMIHELMCAHKKHNLAIHSFVLMGNHFHLLCHRPSGNLDEVLPQLMRKTAAAIPHQWDPDYQWTQINNRGHYYQVYRYIYQNPVRAGLVNRVESYRYSTLRASVPFPLHCHIPFAFGGPEGELLWLNQLFSSEDRETIQEGLMKSEFDVGVRHLDSSLKLRSAAVGRLV
jgi:putative transposase